MKSDQTHAVPDSLARRTGLLFALLLSVTAWAYDTAFTSDPSDPGYGPAPAGTQCQRAPGQPVPSPTCFDPPGQWSLFSFVPTSAPTSGNHPSGISVDLAWRVTTGRPDVEIAVFDTGVNYDHVDLRNQIWLNRGELPVPDAGCVATRSDPYDCNNDGIFNIRDYAADTRIDDELLPNELTRSDLRVFEDGIDGDGNGYVDDISGWDFDDVDSDEYDHRDFGHGTGRNGFSSAEPNNGVGLAGVCPNCRVANARIEDTYVVVRADTTANAAIWAADHGFEVITMALGHVSASSMSRKAFEYAWTRNVLPMSAIANEFHFHHGFVGLYDEVMAIGALSYAGPTTAGIAPRNEQPAEAPTTYMRKANFSNYGAHLQVVAPSDSPTTTHGSNLDNDNFGDSTGTSSAVPLAVGTAALVYSAARNEIAAGRLVASNLAFKDISNQEVRQVLIATADDITTTHDPAPGSYPVKAGWDKWTGYGRINAKRAVDLVVAGRIPPEADINAPDWYSYVDGIVNVRAYANNRWRSGYNWTLELGAGIEPTAFTTVATGSGFGDKARSSRDLVDNLVVPWDTTGLANGGYTLRLRVVDAADSTLLGEDRMFVWVRRGAVDPDHLAGWPTRVTRDVNGVHVPVSLESQSTALVDLDGDNRLEVVLTTADGEIRAYRADGSLLPGFPVMAEPLPGLPLAASPAFGVGRVPVVGAALTGGVAVGDIDRDGMQEICASGVNGKVYCWNADGSVQPGFPVSGDVATFREQYSGEQRPVGSGLAEAFVAPPTFANLDGDSAGTLEIFATSRDQKLYAWDARGARVAGFPALMVGPADTLNTKATAGSISGVLVTDLDGDGIKEILAGTNEVSGSTPNTAGRVHAFKPDGTRKTGWPVSPPSPAANGVPIVAAGVVNGPLAANFDGDPALEVAVSAFLGDVILYNPDGTQARTLSGAHAGAAPAQTAPEPTEETPAGGPARQDDAPVHSYAGLGAIGDLNTTSPGNEYVMGTVGNNLITDVAAGSGQVTHFDHYLSVWNTTTGAHVPVFPRVMEGWMFLTGPVIADIGGAAGPEAIAASSGLFVHAFNGASGTDVAGWPKFTGAWHVNTPAVGDLDDDGTLEVVTVSRLGQIHVWKTAGPTCAATGAAAPWRKYRHDEWNTGAFGTDTLRPARPSDFAVSHKPGGRIEVSFTAVGDDGRCGRAAGYDIRVNGTPVTGLSAPKPAGQVENFSLAGPGVVTLAVLDEAGNASGVVSSASAAARQNNGGGALAAGLLAFLAFGAVRRRRTPAR